jgi:sigma-B regulation protein RsbU (phosphoserine phosphatase)
MFHKWSIAWRLSVSVLLASVLILSAVIGYGYIIARQILEQELEAKAWQMARATTGRIELVEIAARKIVDGMDGRLENYPPTDKEVLFTLLERLVRDNEEIYGATVALEPGAFGYSKDYTAPYVYRSWNQLVRDDRGKHATPYFVQDWYAIPQLMQRPVWIEPYRAEGRGNVLMVTYASPMIDAQGKFLGVVSCDISLEWLTDLLHSLPLGKDGFAFLISRNGTLISHPNRTLILNESMFSLLDENGKAVLRSIGRDMVQGKSGFIPYSTMFSGQHGWLLYQPIATNGWSIGIFFPEAELMGKVAELSRIEAAIAVVGFLLLIPVVLLIARSITGPLRKLAESTRILAAGSLDAPLPQIAGDDEVARLAKSFVVMRDELKTHITMLEVAATSKERIESELRIAQRIQMELVPKTFPPFPDRDDFELYAMMTPAREVGGDFYDFMMPDSDHLWIVIGDVSGKGIAAALFMAVTRTFLRAFFHEEKSPGKVLYRVNNELSRNNEASMFVTLFCGVLHLPSGQFRWANAGHNLPLLLPAGGVASFLPKTRGVVAGAMEDIQFAEAELTLAAGDSLYLYTDGVNEAMNAADQLFGNDRMQDALICYGQAGCVAMVEGISRELTTFVDGAEQSDDITMLALRYCGPSGG